jgi:hypothetical protein
MGRLHDRRALVSGWQADRQPVNLRRIPLKHSGKGSRIALF